MYLSATVTTFQADQLFERNECLPSQHTFITHRLVILFLSLSLSLSLSQCVYVYVCLSIYLNLGWRLCLSSHLITMGRAASSSSSSIESSNHPSISSASSLSQLKRDLSTDLRLGLSISASQHNSSSCPGYYLLIPI